MSEPPRKDEPHPSAAALPLEAFPSLHGITYLNTAAEGIPPRAAGEALDRYLAAKCRGMDGRETLFATFDSCRTRAAETIGTTADEVSFCSSTSEAYNILATSLPDAPGGNIVTTDLDFPSGSTPWLRHPARPELRLWKHRSGVLELEDLAARLDRDTRLVQISLVSFLTGYRIPWAPLRDLVREKSPDALLAVDVTQAAGRIELDCLDADCLFASTYKWLLGIHGGCVVAVPESSRDRVATQAGGWLHIENAFESDRFERVTSKPGAEGFAVGMPSFASIYALEAGLGILLESGIGEIAKGADPLVLQLHEGLADRGIATMAPPQPGGTAGIVSFQHEKADRIEAELRRREIHIMHQAGRLRVSVHGYNSAADVEGFLDALSETI